MVLVIVLSVILAATALLSIAGVSYLAARVVVRRLLVREYRWKEHCLVVSFDGTKAMSEYLGRNAAYTLEEHSNDVVVPFSASEDRPLARYVPLASRNRLNAATGSDVREWMRLATQEAIGTGGSPTQPFITHLLANTPIPNNMQEKSGTLHFASLMVTSQLLVDFKEPPERVLHYEELWNEDGIFPPIVSERFGRVSLICAYSWSQIEDISRGHQDPSLEDFVERLINEHTRTVVVDGKRILDDKDAHDVLLKRAREPSVSSPSKQPTALA